MKTIAKTAKGRIAAPKAKAAAPKGKAVAKVQPKKMAGKTAKKGGKKQMKMVLKTKRAKAVATGGRKVTKKAQPKVSKSSRKGTRQMKTLVKAHRADVSTRMLVLMAMATVLVYPFIWLRQLSKKGFMGAGNH